MGMILIATLSGLGMMGQLSRMTTGSPTDQRQMLIKIV